MLGFDLVWRIWYFWAKIGRGHPARNIRHREFEHPPPSKVWSWVPPFWSTAISKSSFTKNYGWTPPKYLPQRGLVSQGFTVEIEFETTENQANGLQSSSFRVNDSEKQIQVRDSVKENLEGEIERRGAVCHDITFSYFCCKMNSKIFLNIFYLCKNDIKFDFCIIEYLYYWHVSRIFQK